MDKEIIIYSKDRCQSCRLTKIYLENEGIPYSEINVTHSKEALKKVKADGFSTMPVVYSNVREAFSGFDTNELDELIKA